MTTITNSKINLTGMDIKKIKSTVKLHRHNKQFNALNYVLFEVNNNHVTVTYNNSNDYVQLHIELFNVTGTAAFLFPIDDIKKLSSTKTAFHEFVVSDNGLTVEHIESGISQAYNVPDVDLFYNNPYNDSKFTEMLTLDYNTLKKLFEANISTSKSETRPVLTNIVLRNNKIISTDSYRLYVNNSNNFNVDEDILIPSYIVSLIDSLTEKDDTLTMCQGGDYLKLHNRNFSITIRGTGGNFPEVDRLVPDTFSTVVKIDEYNKFKKTLEVIKKLKDWNNVTKVKFDYNNRKLYVSDMNNKINTEINITVKELDRNLDNIAFNAAYMLDSFKQLKDDQIVIKFIDSVRPFIIQSENDTKTLVLQLPVKIK